MSSLRTTVSMSSYPHPLIDECQWLITIRRTLEDELESDAEIPVSIFNVPKTLMFTDPDSYTPQEVAIGPYHCWRPELYEMERYKLAAAKRIQTHLPDCCNLKFEYIVDQIIALDLKIRSCYQKFLNFGNETLAWMMAIDASFLLEFLQTYGIIEGKVSVSSSSMSAAWLVDYEGTKSSHNAILRDIIMLENQIPLFVLRKLLQVQHSSLDLADDMLQAMLMGFCKELFPFEFMKNSANIQVSDAAHLLDFLYQAVVSKAEQPSSSKEIEYCHTQNAADENNESSSSVQENYQTSSANSTYVQTLLSELWKLLSEFNIGPISFIKKVLVSKPVEVFFKLPWTILSKLPGFQILAQPVQSLLFAEENGNKDAESISSNSNNSDMNKPPSVDEIAIPSVTVLAKSKVRFLPSNGNISTISFDTKSVTLYLPTISLDLNTEVVLRNLVAYEASSASGPLILTRYTELMNGIIDTEEDVKLLKEKGIIINRLKSDAEAANLWNGMSKSIRLTKVPLIDKVIEDVNKYYNGRWIVKFGKYMRIYVFGSWQCLTLLATILLLVLMTLQSVCSVYDCSRKFHIATA